MEIKMPDPEVSFDARTLASVADQADGDNATLRVEQIENRKV